MLPGQKIPDCLKLLWADGFPKFELWKHLWQKGYYWPNYSDLPVNPDLRYNIC